MPVQSVVPSVFKDNAVDIAHQILKASTEYEIVDMIRVAQSLLKQDYIVKNSSPFLGDLMIALSSQQRSLMLTRMPEYHNLQLPDFLSVVLQMDAPLPESEEFEVQLWIKQYLEEPVCTLAKKVWNKYYSNVDVIRSDQQNRLRLTLFCKYGLDAFGTVDMSTVDAFVDSINVDPSLLYEYIESIASIVQGCVDQNVANQQMKLFARVVECTASLVDHSQLEKLFDFIVYDGYLSEVGDIPMAFEKAGVSV